jgi:hypothetical protein
MNTQPTDQKEPPSAEFIAFDKAMRKALAVPKAELDRREAEWRKQQDAKPKPGKKKAT